MKKICELCGDAFDSEKSWAKYCKKDKCQKENNRIRQEKYKQRHKNNPLAVNSFEEYKIKHQEKYNKIMEAVTSAQRDKKRITKSYLSNKTGLSRSTLKPHIETLVKFRAIDKKTLEQLHELDFVHVLRFEPEKIWHKEFINSCPKQNIMISENSAIFHDKISFSDLKDRERLDVLFNLQKLQESYFNFCSSLWIVGLRMANEEWLKFLEKNKSDLSQKMKRVLWLELIRIHFLATERGREIEKRKKLGYTEWADLRRGLIHPVIPDFVNSLKNNNYEKTHYVWTEKFTKYFRKYYKIISLNEIPYSVKRKFNKLCEKTLNIRLDSDAFVTVLRPEQLINFRLMMEINKKKKQWKDNINKKNRENSLVDKEEIFPVNVLEKMNLFKSSDIEINKLGFDNRNHIFKELEYLTKAFTCP